MKYTILLCLLFAVTAVSVTATVCAVIGVLTVFEEIWKFLRKFFREIISDIREELEEIEEDEV